MENIYSSSAMKILEATPAMIYTSKNETKSIQWCNQFMINESGYSLDEMREMGIRFFQEIMHPDDYELAIIAQKKIREKRNYFGGATRMKGRFDKEWHWVIGIAVPFTHKNDGSVDEVICVFINLNMILDTPSHVNEALKLILHANYRHILNMLTRREIEVLNELVKRSNLLEVSKQLEISYNTLNVHLRKIKRKLEVKSTNSLIALAQRMGLG